MPELQQRSALGREARIVNMSELGKALTELDEPPVKAMVVYNSNPAAIAPNQNLVLRGFRRADLFTVVLEQFQTDTRGSRRHSAARRRRSWSTPICIWPTGIIICNWRGPRWRRPAKRARTSRFSARWLSAWASTTPVSANRKTT